MSAGGSEPGPSQARRPENFAAPREKHRLTSVATSDSDSLGSATPLPDCEQHSGLREDTHSDEPEFDVESDPEDTPLVKHELKHHTQWQLLDEAASPLEGWLDGLRPPFGDLAPVLAQQGITELPQLKALSRHPEQLKEIFWAPVLEDGGISPVQVLLLDIAASELLDETLVADSVDEEVTEPLVDWLYTILPSLCGLAPMLRQQGITSMAYMHGLHLLSEEQQMKFWTPILEAGSISRIQLFLLQAAAEDHPIDLEDHINGDDPDCPIGVLLDSVYPSLRCLLPFFRRQGINNIIYLERLAELPFARWGNKFLQNVEISRVQLFLLLAAMNASLDNLP